MKKKLVNGISLLLSLLGGGLITLRVYAYLANRWKIRVLKPSLLFRTPSQITPRVLLLAAGAAALFVLLACALYCLLTVLLRIRRSDVRRAARDFLGCFSPGRTIRGIGAMLLAVALSAALGTALMIGVYALPVGRAEKNVARSAEVYREEGEYPILYRWCSSRIDGWTDAIMLMTAVDEPGGGLVDRAMGNRHWIMEKDDPARAITEHYLDGKPYVYEFYYGRYWHGYLLFLKPLLYAADLRGIRLVNGCCQLALAALTVWLMVKRRLKRLIVPFLLLYLMLMPVLLAKCLQYSACYYVAVLASAAVLLTAKPGRPDGRTAAVFVFAGVATAYFDFLTYPTATFGVPFAVWLAAAPGESTSKRLGKLVKSGFGWVVGYLGMWASKWIIGGALTGRDLLSDAEQSIRMRTSNATLDGLGQHTFAECLRRNLYWFFRTPFTVLVIVFLLVVMGRCLLRRDGGLPGAATLIPYALTAAIPIAWYAMTVNHSTIHYWFAHKSLSVFLFAVLCAAAEWMWSCRSKARSGGPPDPVPGGKQLSSRT